MVQSNSFILLPVNYNNSRGADTDAGAGYDALDEHAATIYHPAVISPSLSGTALHLW